MEWRRRGEVCKESSVGEVSSGTGKVSIGSEVAAPAVLFK